MTAGPSQPAWFVRPRVVLPLLVALLTLSALFASTPVSGRSGDPRLSPYSTDPQGAKLFAEYAERTGWNVTRGREPGFAGDAAIVDAVLAPDGALSSVETRDLLQRVRAGGRALIVLGRGTQLLADSLHLSDGLSGGTVEAVTTALSCPDRRARTFERLWTSDRAFLRAVQVGNHSPLRVTDTLIAVRVTASSDSITGQPPRVRTYDAPALLVATLGRGRVVVAADPDVLRNDALRVCVHGLDVAAARALAMLTPERATRRDLRFDEYHHGYGARLAYRTDMLGAVTRFLSGTPPGRTLSGMLLASLLFLFAVAPRGVGPVDVSRVERRSPFEHVDALARAYAQVGATRTGAARLVHGLRRRLDRGASRSGGSDADYLRQIASRYPALAADVDRLLHALETRVPSRDFLAVGDAVIRIEQYLRAR